MTARGPAPLLALLAVGAVAALAAWLLILREDDSGDGSENASLSVDQPVIVAEDELRELAGAVGHQVYWAGPEGDTSLELTNTSDGRVYVRYLTSEAEAGDPRPEFLTVGTYPVPDALQKLEEAAGDGFTRIELEGGGLATYDQQQPSSIHFAYPDSDFEIEVFDPSPKRAIELITQGEVQPIE